MRSLLPDNLHLRERSIDNRRTAVVDIYQYGQVFFRFEELDRQAIAHP
ncbi:hypothetical protein [Pseudomonas batumici]|uniref:Uncharacterized protein n=1 Tax=Pseudomonas batumici TaxID=226910 RepID=A0A0C2I496_9PSED|nr:hypothetical protein [Pseudomonas batumici]KIH81790.1 hypothetical protein UCMB321_4453 [Pseudomonas batumici]